MARAEDLAPPKEAVAALDDEDVPRAQAVMRPLFGAKEPGPATLAVGGMTRFFEQRYAEAADLLERSGVKLTSIDYLALARAAREVTKDHARFEGEHFVVSYPRGKDEVLVPYVVDALER